MQEREKLPAITTTEAKFSITKQGKILVAMIPAYEAAIKTVEGIEAGVAEMLDIEGSPKMLAQDKGKKINSKSRTPRIK